MDSKIRFGVCGGLDAAAEVKEIGFDFLEGTVAGFLMPDASDEEWNAFLSQVRAAAFPVEACNCFIPGKFRLTGPAADHAPALEYAVKACRRADVMGVKTIVLGSGGARNVPEGFSLAEGRAQFIAFARELGKRIADCAVTIALEPLNRGESNILNSVADGISYVDEIDSPKIRLLADFYHMALENESAESLVKAGSRLVHCHIAEKAHRTSPGAEGDDFAAQFAALAKIGYAGRVSCECAWPSEPAQIRNARVKALSVLRGFSA